jgi:3-oxoadipate enol-lactonase
MWLAIHAQERVERLVLACTAARIGTPERWAERARIVRANGMSAISRYVVDEVWFTPSFHEHAPDVVERHRAMLEATPPEGYAACCEALEAWEADPEKLATISAPTLLIAGADDPATPPSELAALHERIGGSRLLVLDPAAHLANVEQADAFATAVLEHLHPHVEASSRG